MITHTRVTPFIEDEYIYAGFTYFLDFNVQTIPQAAIISKRIGTNHGEEMNSSCSGSIHPLSNKEMSYSFFSFIIFIH